MSAAPATPYQPYADAHQEPKGPGDARPTALQVVKDNNANGKLRGKTILITGTSSGIGVETARALYETGAQLYLTARDLPKLEKVINDIVEHAEVRDAPRPQPLELHLDSLDSVRSAVAQFRKQSSQLHVLINNAGVMASPYSQTRDGFELQIGTNHFAHFLLFQLLKPVLLSSSTPTFHSRVVNLASSGHRLGGIRQQDINFTEPGSYNKWLAYGQSKTANIYMPAAIERHYSAQGLHGLSVHPGVIETELMRHLDESDLAGFGWDQIQHLAKNPAQGAATTVWAALSPHFEGQNGGRYLEDCGESVFNPDPAAAYNGYASHIYNEEAEEALWKLSNDLLGLPSDSY